MAELIYLYGRDSLPERYSPQDFETITDRILPDNAPSRTELVRHSNVAYCLTNPSPVLPVQDKSVCMGQMIPYRKDWHRPDAPVPDGSYGIVRADEDAIEVISDVTASRTLYYYLVEDLFVVSTSQRAVMHFVDSFVPDERAIAWMVSSGSLGPCQSWDRRIEALLPDTRLRLDRSSWEITVTRGEAWESFDPTDRSEDFHRDRLEKSLDRTFDELDVDLSRWTLPLSGGLDSRELLLRFRDDPSLTTLTWGTDEALEDPDSDAVRAKQLADACDVPHRYYTLPQNLDDVETVFERFVTASEGRIDHVSGYADGFGVFESLAKNDVEGLIRGDEGFGWEPVTSPSRVRHVIGAEMIADFESLPSLPIPGVDAQELPDRYGRHTDESLEMWRDRLYHTYRIPIILGALTSLKTPYVEVVNPFLTREILSTVRTVPDDLRTEKRLYTKYVMNRSPSVPVAKRSANPAEETVLGTAKSREYLYAELDTTHARSVLGNDIIDHALDAIDPDDSSAADTGTERLTLDTIKREIGGRLPSSVITLIENYTPVNHPGPAVSDVRLAFRLYLIQSMFERLEEDVDRL